MADLIKIAEEAFATGKSHPSFKAGDTITVAYKIVEGNKERIQLYRGVVIKISGKEENVGMIGLRLEMNFINNVKIIDMRVVPGDSGFLLDDGETSILYDTGFAFTGEALAKNVKDYLQNRKLDYIFLTHSH